MVLSILYLWFKVYFIYGLKYTLSMVYNYLQQLCREIIEFLLYRGFPRPIWPPKYHERSEGNFSDKVGQGNPR